MDRHEDMEQLISTYYDGEASAQEEKSVEEHLKTCPSCRQYFAQLRKISSSLAAWSKEDLSPDLEQKITNRISSGKSEGTMMRSNVWQGVSALAVIMILFGTFILVTQKGSPKRIAGLRMKTEIALEKGNEDILSSHIARKVQSNEGERIGQLAKAESDRRRGDQKQDLWGAVTAKLKESDKKSATDDIGEQFSPGNTRYLQQNKPNSVVDETSRNDGVNFKIVSQPTAVDMNQQVANVDQEFWGKIPGEKAKDAGQYEPYDLASNYADKAQSFEEGAAGGSVMATREAAAPASQVAGFMITERIPVEPDYYPTTPSNTERYEAAPENEFLSAQTNPLSTFSIDVDTASYSNIRRFLNNGQLPPKEAVRLEEMINYFHYDYPQPKDSDPVNITLEAGACPWNSKHNLVMVGLQGKTMDIDRLPPSNLVFLIDVSGSMEEPNKLPLLKSSFKMLVKQLRNNDSVAIVTYAGNAGLVLESTPGQNQEKILNAIDHLQAGGSTAGGAGIELAYKIAKENFRKEGNNRVILATDGDFNVGVSSDEELVKVIEAKRREGIFLTVLGFGTGNIQDAKMEKLADKGNGNYAYIDSILEGEKVFVHQLTGTLWTIAKDVKLQLEFNPGQVKAYRLLGYENRMLAKEDFNNDLKDAGEMGSGHQVTAFYEIIPAASDEQIGGVEPLKYQKTEEKEKNDPKIVQSDDLLTVKLRYKNPDEDQSKLLSGTIGVKDFRKENLSENFRFASAVAEAGLLFKDSQYQSKSSFGGILDRAEGAATNDPEGYRAEFIKLIRSAKMISGKD